MIHLYTGNGKGKTSAAVGLCIRASGWGQPVCFAQFMKGNETGELHVLEKLSNVTILRSKKDFGFYHSMCQADQAELTEIHNDILDKLLSLAKIEKYKMIVMDEITYPVKWELLDIKKLKQVLAMGKNRGPGETELVLTGRGADKILIDAADYVTEMTSVRHPYEKGIKARKGIEF